MEIIGTADRDLMKAMADFIALRRLVWWKKPMKHASWIEEFRNFQEWFENRISRKKEEQKCRMT